MKMTIRKKIFLLTAVLSLALIIVSIVSASLIFNARIRNDAKEFCNDSAQSLSGYLSTFDLVVSTSGQINSFIGYYKEKLDAIYDENREEIEKVSLSDEGGEQALELRKQYFTDLTAGIFGGSGFGASLDIINFRAAYNDVLDEMQRMASIEGMKECQLYYFDSEHDNLVYMCDSTVSNSVDYNDPCSVEKASETFVKELAGKDKITVVSIGEIFAGYAPVKSTAR